MTIASPAAVVPQSPNTFVTHLLRRSDPLVSECKLTGSKCVVPRGLSVFQARFGAVCLIQNWGKWSGSGSWLCLVPLVGQLKAQGFCLAAGLGSTPWGSHFGGRWCCPLQILLINFSHLGHLPRQVELSFSPSLWNLVFSTCVLQEQSVCRALCLEGPCPTASAEGLSWLSRSCGFREDHKHRLSPVLVFSSNYTSFTVAYLCH